MSQDYLCEANIARLPSSVRRPAYDRRAVRKGIVHFGPGAFHRAHQAQAFDDILLRDPRWGIVGVSLHSTDARDALIQQDGLFTLALLDEKTSFGVIGSIKDVLVAHEGEEIVLRQMAAPETELVTLTITEKGYCLGADGQLDLNHADIRYDLEHPEIPRSAIGYIAEALKMKRAAKLAPFAVISCDNLAGNGAKLRAAVVAFARERDAELAKWIEGEVAFPSTMVDSITPATTDALRARVGEALGGLVDRWPIQREAFTQWVIERDPRLPNIDWAAGGIEITNDVHAFERAKLRILNASHSSLAYLGLVQGHETVFEAISDPELAAFVRGLMGEDIGPYLNAPGLNVPAYAEAVQKRFRNPEIRHLLSQIAWDGSQKLPNRLFPVIEEALAAGRPVDRPAKILAAWFAFLVRKAREGDKLVDPLAPLLLETAGRANCDAAHDTGLFLALDAVVPRSLAGSERFRKAVAGGYAELLNRV